MNSQNLIQEPVWKAEELGQPMPGSTHAVSVALPRWQDVVGYEEKKPEVIQRLLTGYPRFVIHSLVQQVARQLGNGRPCLPFPSERVAEMCAQFIRRTSGAPAEVVAQHGAHGVVTNAAGEADLRAFWQHTGLIISTRQAEAILEGRVNGKGAADVARSLRRQLAGFYDCAEDDVFLAPTGMAAMFAALRAVNQRTPGRPAVQLGFPYVDTLKLQQKLGNGGILLHKLDGVETELRKLLERQPLAGCFCEIPGNPLLCAANLREITPILRQYGVPLVADDVVATPANVNLNGHADLIATSLTKFIVGSCDVMGGALICNPRSPYYAQLKSVAQVQHEELLGEDDIVVMDLQARSFPERMRKHNETGLLIAERLRRHPAIERIWYPKWECSEAYEAIRCPGGGWGALMAILPKNAAVMAPVIYDRMRICKGPSLGAVFSLACPFTLLAHFTELDWAESCGVSRYLIRLSVGLEDAEDLWRRLDAALSGA